MNVSVPVESVVVIVLPVTEIFLVVTVPTGLHIDPDTGLAVTVEVNVFPLNVHVSASVQAAYDVPPMVAGTGKVNVNVEELIRSDIP